MKRKISGNYIDVFKRKIIPVNIIVTDGIIASVEVSKKAEGVFILPGFIDSHVHVESSLVTPAEFYRAAVPRGTIGVINDPHEIANVLGMAGVKYMIEDARRVPFNFWFGAPSCVPSTGFETSGAALSLTEIDELLSLKEVVTLSELMNYPGVIHDDEIVLQKIALAKKHKKPIDGHAPGLSGKDLKKYIDAGIKTDHECSTIDEALEKLSLGMKIIIREGSAARNLNALKPLVKTHPNKIMFCSDDLHPDILAKSHINKIAADLICERYDLFDVIKACCLNPVMHYNLNPGLLLSGQKANFIIVDDYKKMDVLETWINGRKVFDRGKILFPDTGSPKEMNNFNCSPVSAEAISVNASGNTMKVIVAADGDLITKTDTIRVVPGTNVDIDTQQDILKIVVKDRYQDQPPAVAFIKGFGLKKGAVACSIAHDSHNIVCVGSSDVEMVKAINEIVEAKGGMAVVDNDEVSLLKLPVAGLMSTDSVEQTAQKYECLNRKIKTLGCNLKAPFMTLSFMALLVIPEIKLSDRGLFDVKTFNFTSLFENR